MKYVPLTVAALSMGLFLTVAQEVRSGQADALDRRISAEVIARRTEPANAFFRSVTTLGASRTVMVTSGFVGIVLLMRRRWPDALLISVGGFGVQGWMKLLKPFFSRARPDLAGRLVEAYGSSFPSGHAMGAAALYLIVAILLSRHYSGWGARLLIFGAAYVVIVSVCFSRVYLGVHYPNDVIGGFLFGTAWALLLASLTIRRIV